RTGFGRQGGGRGGVGRYNTTPGGMGKTTRKCRRDLNMRKIRLKSKADDRLAEHFARDLNDSQRAAATAPDGYNLILAGPGSGKTRVITYRVAYLIAKGVPA